MNKLLVLIIIIILVVGGWMLLVKKPVAPGGQNDGQNNEQNSAKELNPLNANYIVEQAVVTLKDGKEEKTISDSGDKFTTEVWGSPISGDINNDGQTDYALVLTQKTTGDVGVYYYVAVALTDQKSGIIAGSNGVPLGDRIEIKDISIVNDGIRVNYSDRKYEGDATESNNLVPVTKTFALSGALLKELLPKQANAKAEAVCTDSGGKWVKETVECQNLSKDWCDKYKGKFENSVCKF